MRHQQCKGDGLELSNLTLYIQSLTPNMKAVEDVRHLDTVAKREIRIVDLYFVVA